MSRIPQRPVDGQTPLTPPDATTAQLYLDHVGEVTARRDRAIDRRAQAWLQIVNAVATAVYLLVLSIVIRSNANVEVQALVFLFLIWVQIATGITQRHGMQRRFERAQWPLIAAAIALMVVTVAFLLMAGFVPGFPLIGLLVPSMIALLGFGGYGVRLLQRASMDPRPTPAARARLDPGARAGTILIGTGLGAIIALLGAPSGSLRSILLLMILLGVVVWMCAMTSTFGLPAIGETWRWPHLTAFALGGIALVGVLLPGSPLAAAPFVPALLGVTVFAAFVGIAFVSGYARRD